MVACFAYGCDQLSTTKQSALKEESFGVRGNCAMCKRTIEKAAAVEGVYQAVWDKKNKKIDVAFDSIKTTDLVIHESIAMAGYDTDKMNGDTAAYNNLHACCQYDQGMEMSLSAEKK